MLIVDPLLCYVSNQRRTVSDERLRAIIVGHFSETHIESACALLHEQAKPLLAVADEESASAAINAEGVWGILQIFQLYDRYPQFHPPQFAVTDLSTLPGPMTALNDDTNDSEVVDDSITDAQEADEALTRRILARILNELRELKSMVVDLSNAKLTDVDAPHEDARRPRRLSLRVKTEPDCSPRSSSTNTCDKSHSPAVCNSASSAAAIVAANATAATATTVAAAASGSVADRASSSPRDSAMRKRGSSRSSNSIEDAVAKIKKQRSAVRSELPKSPSPSGARRLTVAEEVEVTAAARGDDDTADDDDDDDVKKSPALVAKRNGLDERPGHQNSLMESLYLSSIFRSDLATQIGGLASAAFTAAAAAAAVNHNCALPILARNSFSAPGLASSTGCPTPTSGPNSAPILCQDVGEQEEGEVKQHCHQLQQHQSRRKAAKKQGRNKSVCGSLNVGKSMVSSGENSIREAKTFKCGNINCNKLFANKFLLKKHEFIHTGERPFQCPYCLNRFNRKDNLLRHKRTHQKNAHTRRRSSRVFGVKDQSMSDDPATSLVEKKPLKICSSPSPDGAQQIRRNIQQQPSPKTMSSVTSLAPYNSLGASFWSCSGGVPSLNN